MRSARIGLLLILSLIVCNAAFAETAFTDGFEGPIINPWWTTVALGPNGGSANLSNAFAHSGTQSVQVNTYAANGGNTSLQHTFSSPLYGTASVWVYYSNVYSTGYRVFIVDNGADVPASSYHMYLDWGTFQTVLYYPSGGVWQNQVLLPPQSTGWHQWTFASTPDGVTIQVDGTTVFTQPTAFPFDTVKLSQQSLAGSSFFDDFSFTPFGGQPATPYTFTDIVYPGATQTIPFGINDSGQIVGTYYDSSGLAHGFLFSGGAFTSIDAPEATVGTEARGINANGDIVGQYYTCGNYGCWHPYKLSGGVFTILPDAPGSMPGTNAVSAINQSGQIVGNYVDPCFCTLHGYLYSNGTYTTIDQTGYVSTQLVGINDLGLIVGNSQQCWSCGSTWYGFLLDGGTYTPINLPGISETGPNGVNNNGDVAGFFNGQPTSFVLSGGVFTFIIDPAARNGATSILGAGINSSKQLTGVYVGADGNQYGFFATQTATAITPTVTFMPSPATTSYGSSAGVALAVTFTGVGSNAPSGAVTISAATGSFTAPTCSPSSNMLTCNTTYTPSGTLPVGTQAAYITASIAAAGTYASASGTDNLVVDQAAAIITFGAAPTPTYLGGNFTVSATTNSNGALSYSYVSGPCTQVSGGAFSSTGAGVCVIQASTAATANFFPGTKTQSVIIGKATPTIVWPAPANIVYGTALSSVQLNATASVPGTFIYSPAAGTVLPAGTSTLSVTFNPTDAADYAAAAASVSIAVNVNGNLTVSSGQTYNFTNGNVEGNLVMTGGTVILDNTSVGGNLQMSAGSLVLKNNSTVKGNLQITGGGTFAIGPGNIEGNLQIQNLPSGAAQNQVCGTAVNGNLQFQNNGTAVELGGAAPCAGNTVSGNLQVTNNTASTQIVGNSVGGNLQDNGNTAPTQVTGNTVSGNLQCSGDSSITGGENTAKSKQGQCATF